MKDKFVNSSIKFITKYQECDDLKLKKLNYGLQGIYSLTVKLTVVIIIAIISKTITQTLLFLLFYSGIRTFSYGLHAKSNLACWIITITFYNIIPYLIKSIVIPSAISYITLVIAFISMILWAPADTPKRPLIHKSHRKKCKILSLIVITIYTGIIILSNNNFINNAITYALITQIIFINPITYKIANIQFNNYKYYKKKI